MAATTPILDGVFAVKKPVGMSSAQVIRDCQAQFNPSTLFKPMIDQQRADRSHESNNKRKRRGFGKNDIRVKMGHGGTLDPLATGVLILGVGKGTKSLQSFLDCTKTYETVVLFGASTDTYDRVGKVLKKTSYDHITEPMVREALKSFTGTFQQMPPLYSALKMEGKPLYEYAREGKPIPREIATREVNVTEMELLEWYEPGTHDHRWPAEDATTFERSFAEQVWKIEKDQMTKEKQTPEQEQQEKAALARHENFKRKMDENVDALIYDKFNKRRKQASNNNHNKEDSMMSGALGDHPPVKRGKGSDLIPADHDPNTPPPWDDKGPPAARVRMTVTSGFYVRSFCHDLGAKIGSSAMMAELCRSRQGDFELGAPNCIDYADVMKGEDTWASQVQVALDDWNSKPKSDSGASQSRPASARPVWSPKTLAKKSIEKEETSPRPNKRKASAEPAIAEDIPSEKKTKKSLSPKPASPRKEEKVDKDVVVPGQSFNQNESKSKDEEEWNGFADDHATAKQ